MDIKLEDLHAWLAGMLDEYAAARVQEILNNDSAAARTLFEWFSTRSSGEGLSASQPIRMRALRETMAAIAEQTDHAFPLNFEEFSQWLFRPYDFGAEMPFVGGGPRKKSINIRKLYMMACRIYVKSILDAICSNPQIATVDEALEELIEFGLYGDCRSVSGQSHLLLTSDIENCLAKRNRHLTEPTANRDHESDSESVQP